MVLFPVSFYREALNAKRRSSKRKASSKRKSRKLATKQTPVFREFKRAPALRVAKRLPPQRGHFDHGSRRYIEVMENRPRHKYHVVAAVKVRYLSQSPGYAGRKKVIDHLLQMGIYTFRQAQALTFDDVQAMADLFFRNDPEILAFYGFFHHADKPLRKYHKIRKRRKHKKGKR